jgi:hypothetical protein
MNASLLLLPLLLCALPCAATSIKYIQVLEVFTDSQHRVSEDAQNALAKAVQSVESNCWNRGEDVLAVIEEATEAVVGAESTKSTSPLGDLLVEMGIPASRIYQGSRRIEDLGRRLRRPIVERAGHTTLVVELVCTPSR